jgi:transposase InsO family protein
MIDAGVMKIRDQERRLFAKVPRSPNRLYVLEVNLDTPVCLAVKGSENAWLWHARFGHLNFPALSKLARGDMVRGLSEVEHVDQVCAGCLAGKHRCTSFPRTAAYRAEEALELIHGDICGPITPATPSGSRYFLLLVDDSSRYMWLRILCSKDQAAGAIKQYKQVAEVEIGHKLKAFRTDRGGEFTSVEFAEYCVEQGVRRQLTVPYSPQQNGVVERHDQTVVGTTHCLLKSKGLPGWLWGEVVATAVYLLNRSLTRSLEGKTPFEAWFGKKPGVHHLCTFGCVVHVKNTVPNLIKLEDRSMPMIFIGYETGSKAYRAYDPVTHKVHVSRDVIFDEQAQWDWSKGGDRGEAVNNDDTFTVEVQYSTVTQGVPAADAVIGAQLGVTPRGSPACAFPSPLPAHAEREGGGGEVEQPTSPPVVREEDLDADHDSDVPLWVHNIDNILGLASPRGLARRVLDQELHAVSSDEPSSFEVAEQDPCWRKAMLEEMQSIEDNQTWSLADLPADRRAIGLK